jgi:hypothetical protein
MFFTGFLEIITIFQKKLKIKKIFQVYNENKNIEEDEENDEE